jgi:hypothetical protein
MNVETTHIPKRSEALDNVLVNDGEGAIGFCVTNGLLLPGVITLRIGASGKGEGILFRRLAYRTNGASVEIRTSDSAGFPEFLPGSHH